MFQNSCSVHQRGTYVGCFDMERNVVSIECKIIGFFFILRIFEVFTCVIIGTLLSSFILVSSLFFSLLYAIRRESFLHRLSESAVPLLWHSVYTFGVCM